MSSDNSELFVGRYVCVGQFNATLRRVGSHIPAPHDPKHNHLIDDCDFDILRKINEKRYVTVCCLLVAFL